MSKSHEGQLLPLKNRVMAADEHTAFLAHYDVNANDVLHGIKPVGPTHSLEFDGTVQGVIVPMSDSLQMNTTNALTLEAWVYPTGTPGSDRAIILISKGAYYLTVSNSFKLAVYWYGRGGYFDSVSTLPTNKWSHIAASWTNKDVSLYINGELDAVHKVGGNGNAGSEIELGGENSNSRRFYGKINDIRVWRTARTAHEIKKSMYDVELEDSNLAARWLFDDGEGLITRDSSLYCNDGLMKSQIKWTTGKSIFTLRPEEGYFGGGVAVEQGTANLIPNGTKNMYPSYGNEHGTYNTNQYNSNTDFSIGTINDVTNNIVTLATVGHAIRTYDVLNPATSGGGVTAGTHYFIKKHSSNSFSLHAYNSSQDGSLGIHVHDTIKYDTRISINATDFPTMWHGAAHLPNSGLVKEIIPNGFSHNEVIHDCIRLHTDYRTDGVVDGMAYGVYPPVTQGVVYTFSFYLRAATPETVGKTIRWTFHTTTNWGVNPTYTATGEWQRCTITATAPGSGGTNMYWWPSAGGQFDIAEIQCEEKPFATSFTEGTRGSSNLEYRVPVSPNLFTLNFWAKHTGNSSSRWYVDMQATDSSNRIFFRPDGDATIGGGRVVGGVVSHIQGSALPIKNISDWHMYTLTSDGNIMSIYQDGVLVGTDNIPMLKEHAEVKLLIDPYGDRNAIFDELRIDKIARTQEEIMAWYQSDSPFWPRGVYRKSY